MTPVEIRAWIVLALGLLSSIAHAVGVNPWFLGAITLIAAALLVDATVSRHKGRK